MSVVLNCILKVNIWVHCFKWTAVDVYGRSYNKIYCVSFVINATPMRAQFLFKLMFTRVEKKFTCKVTCKIDYLRR